MALVTLPEGQQRSGKQGGMVWSHNRGGPYVRNRTIPTNPNTDRQVTIRLYMRNLAIAWDTELTQDQRDAWDTYASNVSWVNRLGQSIVLTGLQHYVRSNVPRLLCEVGRVDEGPTIFDIAQAEQSLACTASEATQLLSFVFDDTAAWCSETGGFEIFYMGIPQNASRKFFGGPWRHVGCQLGQDTPNGEPASPYAIAGAWPFAEGQRIWVRTRIGRADGRLSEFAQVNFLAAA